MPRRSFLYVCGTAIAGLAASSCGTDPDPVPELTLVSLFSTNRVTKAGIEARLPFAIIDNGIDLGEEPALVEAISAPENVQLEPIKVESHLVSHSHSDGVSGSDHPHTDLQRYYPLRVTLPVAGVYLFEVKIAGQVVELPVQAFENDEVKVLGIGDQFPAISTPTFADSSGVDPICTRSPGPCPFHSATPAELLSDGLGFVLLVSSPAYCSSAYCGPVLELLVEKSESHDELLFVHAEVYSNPKEVDGDITSPDIDFAPVIESLGLETGPALFVVDGTGTVVERLDSLFDSEELDQALDLIRVS